MPSRTLTPEEQRELDEEIDEELEDEWEDDGSESPGAILLRKFGEVRRRILIVLATMVVFAIGALSFATPIFEFLLRPLCSALPEGGLKPPPGVSESAARVVGGCTLYPTDVMEPMIVYFKMSLLLGLFGAAPVVFWQIWQVLKPYMAENVRRWVVVFVFSATTFFVGGAAFGFFLVFPNAFAFMLTVAGPQVQPLPTMASYFSIVSMLLLGFGVSFELPLMMFMLSKIGITNAGFYAKYWRHAVFVLLIFAAGITPTTDPITMASLAGPLAGLYFLGIGLSMLAGRSSGPTLMEKRLRELDILLDDEDEEDDEADDEDEPAPGGTPGGAAGA